MKKLFILLMLFIYTSLMAQIGISFKSGVLNTILNEKYLISYNNEPAKGITSYIPELSANYDLVKNTTINLGVGYNKIGIYYYLNVRTDVSGIGEIVKFNQNYHYISIPLYFSYKYKINNLFIGADIGSQANVKINVEEKNSLNIELNSSDEINETASSVVLYAICGLRLGYEISDNLSVDITGRYYYSITEINNEAYMPNNTNSIGLLAGINYNF